MTLEELCVARGLTLPQLAEAAGVPLLTAFEIDAGTRRPPPLTLRRLADVLDLAPGALLAELAAAGAATPIEDGEELAG